MEQLAVKGIYREGVIAPEHTLKYVEGTEVILVFPIRKDMALVFESVENEEIKLIFRQPIEINLVTDEHMLFLNYPALNINAYGQNLEEVIQAFYDVFITTFEHYTAQPDDLLAINARNLKVVLLDLVQERVDLTEIEQ